LLLLDDLQQSRVLQMVDRCDTKEANALWTALPPEQRGMVEAATMDMGANSYAAPRRAANAVPS
jgi:hypothetical protein